MLQFFSQKTAFSKTIKLCLNFCMEFCINQLVLSNYKKPVHKSQFYFNHACHLNCLKYTRDYYRSFAVSVPCIDNLSVPGRSHLYTSGWSLWESLRHWMILASAFVVILWISTHSTWLFSYKFAAYLQSIYGGLLLTPSASAAFRKLPDMQVFQRTKTVFGKYIFL